MHQPPWVTRNSSSDSSGPATSRSSILTACLFAFFMVLLRSDPSAVRGDEPKPAVEEARGATLATDPWCVPSRSGCLDTKVVWWAGASRTKAAASTWKRRGIGWNPLEVRGPRPVLGTSSAGGGVDGAQGRRTDRREIS